MIQLTPKLRLIQPNSVFADVVQKVELRGYSNKEPVAITGGMKWAIENDEIKAPTVDEVVSFAIGRKSGSTITWGRAAGMLVDSRLKRFFEKAKEEKTRFPAMVNYESVRVEANSLSGTLSRGERRLLERLKATRSIDEEDESILLLHLRLTITYELALFSLNQRLGGAANLYEPLDAVQTVTTKPKSEIIGLSAHSDPDFLVPSFQVAGDIKTGVSFEKHHKLTCAGYALAYESEHGAGHEINFGAVYFFPTRTKEISLANLYLFAIDEPLRREFLDRRNGLIRQLIREKQDNARG